MTFQSKVNDCQLSSRAIFNGPLIPSCSFCAPLQHCSHAHWCLYPSRQIPSNCDHILAILCKKTPSTAISGLWVALCGGLGNITSIDLGRPFKRRQQCLSGIPQRICTYALEWKRGRAHIPSRTALTISLWWGSTERRLRGPVEDEKTQWRLTV